MIEIVRERSIPASSRRVWDVVSDARRLPDWYARAQRVEVLSGEGLGRRQRVISQWHGRPSEIDQVVTVFQPERELEWRHEAELLDGQPAPRFSAETLVSIRLSPEGQEVTHVTLVSRQRPADAEKEAVMRGNSEQLGQSLEASLERLEAVVRAG
ncbi:MAG TPA: SRPBCC domain-containing protein [Candidatus Dormibacteraeota bacterium]|nr:SRPBCC domain-containing protein [Candidatus Dormibacteraeota bacterium]